MKKISLAIGFLLAVLMVDGQTDQSAIKWYTFEQAVELNKTHPKKLLIDVYTDWCGWCKKMDADTWSNPVIAKYINEHYYPVKFNAEQKTPVNFQGKTFTYVDGGNGRGYNQLAAALLQNQLSFPTVAYMNEKLELLGPVPGYKTAKEMEPILVFISEDKYKTEGFDAFQKTFVSNIK